MTTRATSRALRLRLLEALLEQAPRTATELALHFATSNRTIQRDLEALEDLGHTLERRGRRYHLAPASTALNPVEALAVHSATRLLVHHTQVNERHYRSALTKLARQLPQPARRFLEASVEGIELLSSDGSRTLDMVAQAWFDGRVLRFDYTAPIGSGRPHPYKFEVSFFEINPMNLAPYVIGRERSFFQSVITLRLDRMAHARLLDERYTVPDDFDPHAHLQSAWGIVAGRPLEVQVRIDAATAPHVLGRRHRNLRVDAHTDDGDVIVTITCGQDKHGVPVDLLPSLLGWGPGVEVLAPEHVRAYVASHVRAAAAHYDP